MFSYLVNGPLLLQPFWLAGRLPVSTKALSLPSVMGDQALGHGVVQYPQHRKRTGADPRKAANALPQTLAAFSWDESCSRPLLTGVFDVVGVKAMNSALRGVGGLPARNRGPKPSINDVI